MTSRPLTDDQLAAGLHAYLPVPRAAMQERIVAEITMTPQERRLPSILGRLNDADPIARRRMMLLVALVALAASATTVAIAGALLREKRAPDLSLEPPADLPAFVRSAYDDMPSLEPMTITALRDGTTEIRIYIDASGAVRIDEFASTDATEPASYKIFAGTTMAELTKVGGKRGWHEQTGAISEDPRVFVFAALGAARTAAAPGCEVAVSPGEEYAGTPARGWRYVALEHVAGRPAHHVRCGDDLWIDVATRLTLRSQAAGTGASGAAPRVGTVEVTSVEPGQPRPELFEIRPPEGVAAISPEEYNCSQDPACSATPAPVITPPPAPAELAADGNAVVAAALRTADELAAFDVIMEISSGKAPKHWHRVVADGSGRFRTEQWSENDSYRSIELIGPRYHYATDQLTDGTPVWRDRGTVTRRGLPTYPIALPETCDDGWVVTGVDEIRGRVADHVRCETPGSSDYWIDRDTHLAVRVFATPDPTSGWEASEVVELRLATAPAELFELPSDASLPTPTPGAGEVVHGWPHTSQNGVGLYSWDGSTCSSTSCVMGFMHNGYGSGDVRIHINFAGSAPIADAGATAVRVAGHDGIHRQVDAGVEEWIVDIEGTKIVIRLEARPGTSSADLADAHGIIASMRTEPEPRDKKLGFRLVFRLTTEDWDSG